MQNCVGISDSNQRYWENGLIEFSVSHSHFYSFKLVS